MKRKISNNQILPNYFTILNFATDNWKPQNLPKLIVALRFISCFWMWEIYIFCFINVKAIRVRVTECEFANLSW